MKVAVVDETGHLVAQGETPTRAHEGRDATVQRAVDLARGVIGRAPGPVVAGGIGSAGRIDRDRGVVLFASGNLPGWTGLELASVFGKALSIPMTVDNDVNAAVFAENWVGAAQQVSHYAMVAIGTGVGGAMVIDGALWRGARWGAGEVGHTILYPGGLPCNCGGRGCAEQYVSARALTRRANELRKGGPAFRGIREVLGAASSPGSEARHQAARGAVAAFTSDLALLLINMQNNFDPEVLLIGGGILRLGYWWPRLEEALEREAALRSLTIDLRPAACGPQAGVIGAARLGMLSYRNEKV